MDTGLRFKMPKQQRKNADLLLQEMFEDELEEDDIGPKNLDDLDELGESDELINERSGRKLTFLTVDADWRAFPVTPVTAGSHFRSPYFLLSIVIEANGHETRQSSLLYVFVLLFGLDPAQNTIAVFTTNWGTN